MWLIANYNIAILLFEESIKFYVFSCFFSIQVWAVIEKCTDLIFDKLEVKNIMNNGLVYLKC